MISGIPACPNHWVPRDATECRHLPCNVSMETLRSPKTGLVWCRWLSAWIGIPLTRHTENINNTPSTSSFGHAPITCLRMRIRVQWDVMGPFSHPDLSQKVLHQLVHWTTKTWLVLRDAWDKKMTWAVAVNPRAAAQTPHRPSTWRYGWAHPRHDASMRQMEWRFSDGQRTSWSAMASGRCAREPWGIPIATCM